MSKKVDSKVGFENISALVEFRRENSTKVVKSVVVKKGNTIIFNDKVTVIVGDYNIYFRLDIIWDDVITEEEYHALGLYGYYSSDYCDMEYSQKILTVDTRDGIVITII